MISSEKTAEILANYDVKVRFHFVRVLLFIGAILVGVGVLSFIAGNWAAMSNSLKLTLLILGVGLFYLSGWFLKTTYPKTSKSMFVIGLFIYGAGIFLVGQMFHYESGYQNAFLAWIVGAIPLAIYLKDRWVALLSILLTIVYTFEIFDSQSSYPFAVWVIIPLLYWLNEVKFARTKIIFFVLLLLTIYVVMGTTYRLDVKESIIPWIMFALGLIIAYLPLARYRWILQWQGMIVNGVASVLWLSYGEYWKLLGVKNPDLYGIFFAIIYLILAFHWIKKGILPAVLIICAMIFRFYFDLSFDFLPKSLFFVIGGALVIAFGFWFEHTRRKEGNVHEKKANS